MDLNQLGISGEEILFDLLSKNEISFEQKAESLAYIKELCSFGVDKLQYEPSRLKEEKDNINDDIQSYAFNNYKTFIKTADCSREIYQDFGQIDTKLDFLVNKIPDFNSKCENFTRNIQNINQARRNNNLTLQKHNQILEILEISQLMDTCVRNEYYDEALELSAYVKRLDKKYGNVINLIQKLNEDVKQSLDLMLKQLLDQLKHDLQFPTSLKIIGLIRRLNVFNESQLRIKFLQSRDVWLFKLLDNIPKDDAYTFLTKTIDENRIHLFDIITQYKALFTDDDLISSKNDTNSDAKLLNCWIMNKIDSFLNILKETLNSNLNHIHSLSRLDSLLSQSMYFGLAFSRVGLDFRVALVDIFEDFILKQVKKSIDNANKKFNESISKFNFNDLNDIHNTTNYNFSINSNSLNPPLILIDYVPFGVYLNEILQLFNELRLCAPLSLSFKVKNELQMSLEDLSRQILKFVKSESQEIRNKFVHSFYYDLVPYIQKCFINLFPLDQLQLTLSIQQNDLENVKDLTYFNIIKVIHDLEPLVKMDNDLYESKLLNKEKPIEVKSEVNIEVS